MKKKDQKEIPELKNVMNETEIQESFNSTLHQIEGKKKNPQ